MTNYYDALSILNKVEYRMPEEEVELTQSNQRILCEEVISDLNMPPFDKSAMDGYACRKVDLEGEMKVLGTIHAGSLENIAVEPKTCVKIMTGAPVPEGADTVIMVEHTEKIDENRIRYTKEKSKSNICKLGEDVKEGEVLMHRGELLTPHKIAVLASCGYEKIKVNKIPRVALISTGSELVEPGIKPKGAQIRNSNAYNLMAQMEALQIDVQYAGIVSDDKESISQKLAEFLPYNDVVILTGGASVGEHDFVPEILAEQNLKLAFNKVGIQPGKPVSFAANDSKFCFGLSGNPVSSFLQFEILVKPFLYHIMGHEYQPLVVLAELAKKMQRKNASRLKFFPIRFNSSGQAEEIKFNGSAHIAGLINAEGFGLFPQDCEELAAEDKIEVLLFH